jgi:hypothetical protein
MTTMYGRKDGERHRSTTTRKGFRDGEAVQVDVTPGLARLLWDAQKENGLGPVGVDDILKRIRPARLERAARNIEEQRAELAALAEERAGL